MHRRALVPCLLLALGSLVASGADAAPSPRAGSARAPSKAFAGKPTKRRGTIDATVAKLPTRAEREGAVGGVGATAEAGSATSIPEVAWASVSVRKPNVDGRAALVFVGADVVDARRNVAAFGLTAPAAPPMPDELAQVAELLCQKIGCPGVGSGPPPAEAASSMQVWVKGGAGKHYMIVCRAKLDDAVGEMLVATDGGLKVTQPIDHTGKSYASFNFHLDPQTNGWYGFTVSTTDAWSTSGCTVDEL